MDMFTSPQDQAIVNSTTFKQQLSRTYIWMFFGLLLTFGIAFYLGFMQPSLVISMYYNMPILPIIMIIAQFGVVIALSVRITKLSATGAKALFLVYAALTGFTFSTIVLAYDLSAIIQAFLVAALYFGCLGIIGLTTHRDLTNIGYICMAGLFAMIIYSLIAAFTGLELSLGYCLIGLVIFAGLTAWDNQKIKKFYYMYQSDEQMLANLSIYSALQLYLDFINIFLYLLRIFGSSKN